MFLTVDQAARLLAKSRDVKEILDVRSKAVALRAWASAKGDDETESIAQEVKLRAERKAGEFLIEMKEKGELKAGRPRGDNSDRLSQLNIERQESSRWQRIAALPRSEFERYVTRTKGRNEAGLLRIAALVKIEERAPHD